MFSAESGAVRAFQTLGHCGAPGLLSILTTPLWGGSWEAAADVVWGDDAAATGNARCQWRSPHRSVAFSHW